MISLVWPDDAFDPVEILVDSRVNGWGVWKTTRRKTEGRYSDHVVHAVQSIMVDL